MSHDSPSWVRLRVATGVGAAFFLCFVLATVAWVRWSPARIPAPAADRDEDASLSAPQASPERVASKRVASKIDKDKILSHRLGVVMAASRSEFHINITNPSDNDWNIESISQPCSCATAEPEGNTIAARSKMPIRVTYVAPRETTEDVRFLTVNFSESSAPRIVIRITASVREPMTLDRKRVDFSIGCDRAALTKSLEVENHGITRWNRVRIIACPAWLTAEPVRVRASPDSTNGNELWRVLLTCDPTRIPLHQRAAAVSIEIVADTPDEVHRKVVGVDVRIQQLLEASPEMLFFGEVAAGDIARATTTIRLNLATLSGVDFEAVIVPMEVPHRMDVAIKRVSPYLLQLNASLQPAPKQSSGYVNGTVQLRSRGDLPAMVEIPFTARVR
jgi:Protein of unknown function (DUF1573)